MKKIILLLILVLGLFPAIKHNHVSFMGIQSASAQEITWEDGYGNEYPPSVAVDASPGYNDGSVDATGFLYDCSCDTSKHNVNWSITYADGSAVSNPTFYPNPIFTSGNQIIISGLSAGNYTVTVSGYVYKQNGDSSLVSDEGDVSVSTGSPASNSIPNNNGTIVNSNGGNLSFLSVYVNNPPPTCNNQGTFIVEFQDANPTPLSYTISLTGTTFSGISYNSQLTTSNTSSVSHTYSLDPGNYNLEITDSYGNSIEDTGIVVGFNAEPISLNVAQASPSTFSQPNGKAIITGIIINGVPTANPISSYTYELDDSTFTNFSGDTLMGLSSGFHTLTLYDGNCQSIGDTFTIYNTNCVGSIKLKATAQPVYSFSLYDSASISVAANGGTSPFIFSMLNYPYNYSGSIYDSSYTFNSLSDSGTYIITAQDSYGCHTDTISVLVPYCTAPLQTNRIVDSVVYGYNGGSATFFVSNGVAPYTFNLYDSSNTLIKTGTNNDSFTFKILPVGRYRIEYIDKYGCSYLGSSPLCTSIFDSSQNSGDTIGGTLGGAGLADAITCFRIQTFFNMSYKCNTIADSLFETQTDNTGGYISGKITGGIRPYNIRIYDLSNTVVDSLMGSGASFNSSKELNYGKYYVIVSDAINCTNRDSISFAASAYYITVGNDTTKYFAGDSIYVPDSIPVELTAHNEYGSFNVAADSWKAANSTVSTATDTCSFNLSDDQIESIQVDSTGGKPLITNTLVAYKNPVGIFTAKAGWIGNYGFDSTGYQYDSLKRFYQTRQVYGTTYNVPWCSFLDGQTDDVAFQILGKKVKDPNFAITILSSVQAIRINGGDSVKVMGNGIDTLKKITIKANVIDPTMSDYSQAAIYVLNSNTRDTIGQLNISCQKPIQKKLAVVYVNSGQGYRTDVNKDTIIWALNTISHNQIFYQWSLRKGLIDTMNITNEYMSDSVNLKNNIQIRLNNDYSNVLNIPNIYVLNKDSSMNFYPCNDTNRTYLFYVTTININAKTTGQTATPATPTTISTISTTVLCALANTRNEILSTSIHELGHGIGLDHTFFDSSVHYYHFCPHIPEYSTRNYMDYPNPTVPSLPKDMFFFYQWFYSDYY